MDQTTHAALRKIPWNKGKLVGQKAPLKLKDIWAMRVRLQIGHRTRELALATRTLRAHSGTLESRSTMRWRSRNKRKCSHLVGSLGGGVCGRQSASGP